MAILTKPAPLNPKYNERIEPAEPTEEKAEPPKQCVTLYGAKEIADYIGCGIATFHRHKDHIPHYRVGRNIRSKSTMLDKFIAGGGWRNG